MDKEARIKELCKQIRSGDNKTALEAVSELRENGWLRDRSLRGADLQGADLRGADLRGADLRGADLRSAALRETVLREAVLIRAVLTGADLRGADLRGTNLLEASLRRVDLFEADLFEASLFETNLEGAFLRRADLRRADLRGADLRRADLRGTSVTGARFGDTVVANVDLSEAKGLEDVQHLGPSHIATNTFYKSEGKIPIAFLKGCGVPDDYIEYILPLTGKVIEFYSCFISYSHAQKEFARRLHDRLQGAGIRCWLDEHQVKPGQDIYAEVNRGIRLWDKVLLCCSEESLTSWWVDNEIKTALEKEQQITKERSKRVRAIIPLNIDGYLFSGEWESGYEAQIRSRLAADFTNWKDHDAFEVEFQKVLTALRTDEGREEPPVPRL